MKVLICETHEAAINRTAELIETQVRSRPRTVLGLATGGTMLIVLSAIDIAVIALTLAEWRERRPS